MKRFRRRRGVRLGRRGAQPAGLPGHGLPHYGQELAPEALRREAQRVLAADCRVEPAAVLEAANRTHDVLHGLAPEEHAGTGAGIAGVDHRLAGAAPPQRDYRRAARLRLHGHDAEILLGGEHKGPGALHMVDEYLGRLVAQHPHVGRQHGLDAREVRPIANHHQPLVRHGREGFHDQRNLLVRHQPGGGQVEVLAALARAEALHIHRREYHRGRAAVDLADAPRHVGRVGHQQVHAMGGALVPDPHVMEDGPRHPALEPARQARFVEILVLEVPGVADRRMDIADVQLLRPGDDPLRHGMAGRDHEVVVGEVELFHRQRHQRQVVAERLAGARQALDERCPGVLALQHVALGVREEIDHAEQVGIGPDLEDLLQYALGAGVGGQPVVHHGHPAELAGQGTRGERRGERRGGGQRWGSHGEISVRSRSAVRRQERRWTLAKPWVRRRSRRALSCITCIMASPHSAALVGRK
ncbi:hypothetical protein D3C72_1192530 [compost metagenome]